MCIWYFAEPDGATDTGLREPCWAKRSEDQKPGPKVVTTCGTNGLSAQLLDEGSHDLISTTVIGTTATSPASTAVLFLHDAPLLATHNRAADISSLHAPFGNIGDITSMNDW